MNEPSVHGELAAFAPAVLSCVSESRERRLCSERTDPTRGMATRSTYAGSCALAAVAPISWQYG